ncbi:hypothetical protein [Micromonospora sp. 4G55]|nr:hypothetical protein [Micromonospora sp. 4G55]
MSLIALINAANRLNVIVQQPAGDYHSGQFGRFSCVEGTSHEFST